MAQPHNYPEVKIAADDDSVMVTVTTGPAPEDTETLTYATTGMLTGCDLRDVLALCGIQAEYTYDEGDGGMFSGQEDTGLADCPNCGKRWSDHQLKPIKDISQRVAPGEPMPAGECPECGALCQEEE